MTVKELFKILLFLFLFTVILAPLTLVLTNKENSSYMTGFIDKPKDSLDILFVGSSKSYRIIYPLQLWNEQGFVSYNLGSSSQDIPISYYVTKYGIEKQHPDLIVLEVGRAYLSEKSQSDAMLHQVWDNLDFNISEYECIKDVADNKEALFLPIIEYHSRWTDLEAKDFSYDKDNQKGTGTYSYVSRYHYPTIIDKSEKEDLPAVSEEYLLKTIELCKSTNTDLLLVGTPSGYDNELDQKIYHSIQDIADNNNINFM